MKKYIAGLAVFIVTTSLVGAQTFIFNKDLKIGSNGQDVTNLQSWLIQNGYHISSIESGALSKGYFGSQTKSAVMKYQKSVGLPSTGFVGSLTRKQLNAVNTGLNTISTSTTSVPISKSLGGLPVGISTLGASGIISVTSGPLSSTVLNVGAQQIPIITARVQAQNSDLSVWGVTIDLGTNTAIYNKIFKNIYIYDGSKLVFTIPLNSTSVVQVQGQYVVGTAGFNVIVPKGTYKDITVKADTYSSIDSSYLALPWYVSIDKGSITAVDGSGVQLSGPSNNGLIVQALTINKSLVDNAQANISVDGTSPTTNSLPVSDTINGNYLGLPIFTFDVYAQNDTLHLHNVAINVAAVQNGTTGTVTAAYLYQGATQVQSASVSGGVATFSNITDGTNGATIPVGTTVPFTVKVDVTGVNAGNLAITASTSNSGTTIYNSIDGNVTAVGSAIGNTITITGNGASYALNAAPSIVTQGTNSSGTTISTSSIVASFPISITSTGLDSYFGNSASSTPAFWFNVIDSTGATVYSGNGSSTFAGTVNTANLNNVKVILPTLPTSVTNGVTQTNTYKVANQNTVNLGTVQFQFDGKSTAGVVLTGGPYKVNLAKVVTNNLGTFATTSFMNGLSAWTTATGANP